MEYTPCPIEMRTLDGIVYLSRFKRNCACVWKHASRANQASDSEIKAWIANAKKHPDLVLSDCNYAGLETDMSETEFERVLAVL